MLFFGEKEHSLIEAQALPIPPSTNTAFFNPTEATFCFGYVPSTSAPTETSIQFPTSDSSFLPALPCLSTAASVPIPTVGVKFAPTLDSSDQSVLQSQYVTTFRPYGFNRVLAALSSLQLPISLNQLQSRLTSPRTMERIQSTFPTLSVNLNRLVQILSQETTTAEADREEEQPIYPQDTRE